MKSMKVSTSAIFLSSLVSLKNIYFLFICIRLQYNCSFSDLGTLVNF